MKVTKKQLKQIIREEIQQEGILDSIKDFFRSRNKAWDASDFIGQMNKLEDELDTLVETYRMRLYDVEESERREIVAKYKDLIRRITGLSERVAIFKDRLKHSKQVAEAGRITAFVTAALESIADRIEAVDKASAFEARKEAERVAAEEKEAMKRLKRQASAEAVRREIARLEAESKAREREYIRRYAMKERDAFSESKLTKEAIKRIIREEIKNAKGNK